MPDEEYTFAETEQYRECDECQCLAWDTITTPEGVFCRTCAASHDTESSEDAP